MFSWGPLRNEDRFFVRTSAVLFFCFTWSALYKIVKYFARNRKSSEWCCRVVTLIHGTVVSILSLYSQLIEGPWYFEITPGQEINNTQMFITEMCFGYFIFDISWCLYHQSEPMIMLFHHTLSLFGMTCATVAHKWGTEIVAVIAGTEITNPLLQIRWFLKDAGYKDTAASYAIDWSFILLFGFLRVGLGSLMLYYYLTHPTADILDLIGKTGATLIYLISLIFYYRILSYAWKKYFCKKSKQKLENGNLKTQSFQNGCANIAANGSVSQGHVIHSIHNHTKSE